MSDHSVTYRACSWHRRYSRVGCDERDCADCRRLTFRATMAAWGMPVKVPTYKGGYPCAHVYAGDLPARPDFYVPHACDRSDAAKLAIWIRNVTATVEA